MVMRFTPKGLRALLRLGNLGIKQIGVIAPQAITPNPRH